MGSLESWGTVAAIILTLECIVGMTLVLGVAFALWRGSVWVVTRASQGMSWADQQLRRGRDVLVTYQAKVVAPIVAAHGAVAGLRALLTHLRAGVSPPPPAPESAEASPDAHRRQG